MVAGFLLVTISTMVSFRDLFLDQVAYCMYAVENWLKNSIAVYFASNDFIVSFFGGRRIAGHSHNNTLAACVNENRSAPVQGYRVDLPTMTMGSAPLDIAAHATIYGDWLGNAASPRQQ